MIDLTTVTNFNNACTTTQKTPECPENQVYISNACRDLIKKTDGLLNEIRKLRVRPKCKIGEIYKRGKCLSNNDEI